MPRTVLSIKAEIRDHSMSVPAPENTIRHNIPNACNNCHKDRRADWALDQMNKWYSARSRQKLIRRADAFARARTGDRDSIPQLLEILDTPAEGPLVRANALGYLTSFSDDARVFPAVLRSLTDPEALVRVYATLRLNPGPEHKEAAVTALKHALSDSATTVRVGATVSLVSMGIGTLPGEDGQRFEEAKKVFRARANLNSDNAEQLLGAGKFYLLSGDPIEAIGALQASLKIDPEIPAKYYLAYAKAQQGHLDEARQILAGIPPTDSQYAKAQNLLKALSAQ
jgi:tetratricopeptide (TPR) repeat protein